jgi:hypothetical protein
MAVVSIGEHALRFLSAKLLCRIDSLQIRRVDGATEYRAYSYKELDLTQAAERINNTARTRSGAHAIPTGRRILVYDSTARLDRIFVVGVDSFGEWFLPRVQSHGFFDYDDYDDGATVRKRVHELRHPKNVHLGPVIHDTFHRNKHVTRVPIEYEGRNIFVMRYEYDCDNNSTYITIDLPVGDEDPFEKLECDEQCIKSVQYGGANWWFHK